MEAAAPCLFIKQCVSSELTILLRLIFRNMTSNDCLANFSFSIQSDYHKVTPVTACGPISTTNLSAFPMGSYIISV